MNKVILCSLMVFSTVIFADTTKLGIVDILEPAAGDNYHSVLGTDGVVYDVNINDVEVLESLKVAKDTNVEVVVDTNSVSEAEDLLQIRSEILSVSLTSNKVITQSSNTRRNKDNRLNFNSDPLLSDYITDIAEPEILNSLFQSQRTDTRKRSQCYNRAHVWAWEMGFKTHNGKRIQPGKAWLFFTKKYIREYRYKWWFHIAPYLTSNGAIKVMDRKFMAGPADLYDWTSFFVTSRQECRHAKVYSDYERNPKLGHCFMMYTSVHYWQPWQIERNEERGTVQTDWNDYELKKAYKNGIGRRARIPQRQ